MLHMTVLNNINQVKEKGKDVAKKVENGYEKEKFGLYVIIVNQL
jgi:hypothetical protein